MGRYVTIIRWKPEQAMPFAKKWANFLPGYPGPQKLKDAATKFKDAVQIYSVANGCIVMIYDIADEDWNEANLCFIHLADVCNMETFPGLTPENYAKSVDMFGEIFPEAIEQMTKE